MDYKNIEDVVKNGLCTRCGTCFAVCPNGAISFDSDYPQVNNNCKNCSQCIRVCPGWDVNCPELNLGLFGRREPLHYLEGTYSDIYLCSATDRNIKDNASGGGLVTGVLTYLFRKGLITGAVVTTMDSQKPWQAKTILARSIEDITSSTQSKYTMLPVNKVLREIKNEEGKFALVALPCQVQGFRKLAAVDEALAQKIYIVIGLYCHLNMEFDATMDLIKNNHIKMEDIRKLQYRGGTWPGRIRVIAKDGRIIYLHGYDIKDGALNYLKRFFSAQRCFLCIDGAAELADFSVADAWIRDEQGGWLLQNQGRWSIAVERTKRGQEVLTQAIADGALIKKTLPQKLILSAHEAMITEKKKGAFIRILKLKNRNRPYPEYHVNLPEVSARDKLRENLYQFTLIPSRFGLSRSVLMKLSFSKLGNIFTGLKFKWKKWTRKVRF